MKQAYLTLLVAQIVLLGLMLVLEALDIITPFWNAVGMGALALTAVIIYILLLMEPAWDMGRLYLFLLLIAEGFYLILFLLIGSQFYVGLAVLFGMLIGTFLIDDIIVEPVPRTTIITADTDEIKKDTEGIKKEISSLKSDLKDIAKDKPAPKRPVIGSATGTKAHDPQCIIVDRIPKKNRVTFDSPKEAIKKGYTLCKVCLPEQ